MTPYVGFLGFAVSALGFLVMALIGWHVRLQRELHEHIDRYARMCTAMAKHDLQLLALEHPEWHMDVEAIRNGSSGPMYLRRQVS